jgi:hypothetical protein
MKAAELAVALKNCWRKIAITLTAIGGPGKALTCICGGDEVTSAVFNYTTGPEHAD